eukprot:gene12548-12680_t
MTKLYVGNISWSTQTQDLMTLFGQYGEVSDAFIPTDKESGRPRGFAFVTMSSGSGDAVNALNETEFMGRTIRVNEALPPGDRSGGGGGYRGGGGGGGGGYRSGGGGQYGGGGYGAGGGGYGGGGNYGGGGGYNNYGGGGGYQQGGGGYQQGGGNYGY